MAPGRYANHILYFRAKTSALKHSLAKQILQFLKRLKDNYFIRNGGNTRRPSLFPALNPQLSQPNGFLMAKIVPSCRQNRGQIPMPAPQAVLEDGRTQLAAQKDMGEQPRLPRPSPGSSPVSLRSQAEKMGELAENLCSSRGGGQCGI